MFSTHTRVSSYDYICLNLSSVEYTIKIAVDKLISIGKLIKTRDGSLFFLYNSSYKHITKYNKIKYEHDMIIKNISNYT